MERSRERILRIIQKEGAANVDTLSRNLGLAPATVRRHLDILQRDGQVSYSEVRKPTGRPEYSFSLTERGHEVMPKAYDGLLAELMRDIASRPAGEFDGKSGPDVLSESFERMGYQSGAGYLARASKEPAAAVIQALSERGFAPQAEETAAGMKITLTNCPFRSVAMSDRTVCKFDSALITRIIGMPVKRDNCVADGARCCVYIAGLPSAAARPATA
jgi:predicted ArsR family transcriptional regulator